MTEFEKNSSVSDMNIETSVNEEAEIDNTNKAKNRNNYNYMPESSYREYGDEFNPRDDLCDEDDRYMDYFEKLPSVVNKYYNKEDLNPDEEKCIKVYNALMNNDDAQIFRSKAIEYNKVQMSKSFLNVVTIVLCVLCLVKTLILKDFSTPYTRTFPIVAAVTTIMYFCFNSKSKKMLVSLNKDYNETFSKLCTKYLLGTNPESCSFKSDNGEYSFDCYGSMIIPNSNKTAVKTTIRSHCMVNENPETKVKLYDKESTTIILHDFANNIKEAYKTIDIENSNIINIDDEEEINENTSNKNSLYSFFLIKEGNDIKITSHDYCYGRIFNDFYGKYKYGSISTDIIEENKTLNTLFKTIFKN